MKNEIKFTLRIDEEIMDDIKEMAEEHNRSANKEIITIIEKAIKEWQQKTSDDH